MSVQYINISASVRRKALNYEMLKEKFTINIHMVVLEMAESL